MGEANSNFESIVTNTEDELIDTPHYFINTHAEEKLEKLW